MEFIQDILFYVAAFLVIGFYWTEAEKRILQPLRSRKKVKMISQKSKGKKLEKLLGFIEKNSGDLVLVKPENLQKSGYMPADVNQFRDEHKTLKAGSCYVVGVSQNLMNRSAIATVQFGNELIIECDSKLWPEASDSYKKARNSELSRVIGFLLFTAVGSAIFSMYMDLKVAIILAHVTSFVSLSIFIFCRLKFREKLIRKESLKIPMFNGV